MQKRDYPDLTDLFPRFLLPNIRCLMLTWSRTLHSSGPLVESPALALSAPVYTSSFQVFSFWYWFRYCIPSEVIWVPWRVRPT